MKKLILVLGMLTCLLGLTACGTTKEVTEDYGVTQEQALTSSTGLVESMNQVVLANETEQYKSDAVIYAALQNYAAALEDMGQYQSVIGHTVTYDEGITIDLEISGSKRNAEVEIILDEDLNYVSISTNVIYSFGEMMAKAGLNTLMGMGTVFVVLILIFALISGFSLISKLQNGIEKEAETGARSEENVAEQIREEEQDDDLELAAVIAAAVAAYEGTASSDGYIVRSIRRRNR